MNEADKQMIYKLRIKGIGYKAIASILGLKRDAVRGYCKRHHLEGPVQVVKLNTPVLAARHKLCLYCQNPIKQKQKGRARKFCSESCRRSWWRENPEKSQHKESAFYTHTCSYCKKIFIAYGNKERKYCNHGCYVKERFEKRNKE